MSHLYNKFSQYCLISSIVCIHFNIFKQHLITIFVHNYQIKSIKSNQNLTSNFDQVKYSVYIFRCVFVPICR